ncbi:hypothetical protein [Thiolapillus sp.]
MGLVAQAGVGGRTADAVVPGGGVTGGIGAAGQVAFAVVVQGLDEGVGFVLDAFDACALVAEGLGAAVGVLGADAPVAGIVAVLGGAVFIGRGGVALFGLADEVAGRVIFERRRTSANA